MEHKEFLKAMNEYIVHKNRKDIITYLDKDVEMVDRRIQRLYSGVDNVLSHLEESILFNKDKERIITMFIRFLGRVSRPNIIINYGEAFANQSLFTEDKEGILIFIKYIDRNDFIPIPLSFLYSKNGSVAGIYINDHESTNYMSSQAYKTYGNND